MTNYMELLQQTIINQLAEAINKRREKMDPIEATAEDVFSNLPMLYDEMKEMEFGRETGNSYKYMPKQYKAMVMRLVAPTYCPTVRVVHSEFGVSAEAFLYLNPEEQKPVAQGKQYLPYESAPADIENEFEKKAYVEATVKGIALSKAYQEFGIGSWHNYRFEPEENPDEALKTMQGQENLQPTIAIPPVTETTEAFINGNETAQSTTDNQEAKDTEPEKKKRGRPKKENKELVDNIEDNTSITDEELPFVSETPISETETTENSETDVNGSTSADVINKSKITLEEALKLPVPYGKAHDAGLTYGDVVEKCPHNLCWLYTQDKYELTDYEKEVILMVVRAFPETQINFIKYNVPF